ncbi:DedA family protein [Crossiella sp. SN42]|uniref:DedA family protein n=1 Tax=Crossiella sp. SN42 TaxID=2944808 RepID=UPI00207C1BDD|nr:DedA family protein [Crossiella sp. SN42]MCO1579587.1 DedA family protein [Crossiella sp. SN42]
MSPEGVSVTLAWSPLDSAGPALVWIIVTTFIFAECGLIIGLFLPGDSLLFAAGVVLANHDRPIDAWALAGVSTLVAILGNEFGYFVGAKTGTKMLAREGGKVLNQQNLDRAKDFLDKYGFWAIVAARWLPWVRTLAPAIAGAAGMDRKRFTWATITGAVTWSPVLILLGYYAAGLLNRYPWLQTVAVIGFVAFFIVGTSYGVYRYRQEMRRPMHEESDGAEVRKESN